MRNSMRSVLLLPVVLGLAVAPSLTAAQDSGTSCMKEGSVVTTCPRDLRDGASNGGADAAMTVVGATPGSSSSSSMTFDTPPHMTGDQWVSQSAACPKGQIGSITWQEKFDVYSDGSNKDTGQIRNLRNTCHVAPYVTGQKWLDKRSSCPSGQTGSVTWQEQYDVYSDGTQKDTGKERNRTNTCHASPPPNYTKDLGCTGGFVGQRIWMMDGETNQPLYSVRNTCHAPSPHVVRQDWVSKSSSCPSNQRGSVTWQGLFDVYSDGSKKWTGTNRYYANTCHYYVTGQQWVNKSGSCPAHQAGSVSWQGLFDVYSDGSKKYTGTDRGYANTCHYYVTKTEWVNKSKSCGSGKKGSITWQERYDTYSNGSRKDAGTKRSYKDTCYIPPPPSHDCSTKFTHRTCNVQ